MFKTKKKISVSAPAIIHVKATKSGVAFLMPVTVTDVSDQNGYVVTLPWGAKYGIHTGGYNKRADINCDDILGINGTAFDFSALGARLGKLIRAEEKRVAAAKKKTAR